MSPERGCPLCSIAIDATLERVFRLRPFHSTVITPSHPSSDTRDTFCPLLARITECPSPAGSSLKSRLVNARLETQGFLDCCCEWMVSCVLLTSISSRLAKLTSIFETLHTHIHLICGLTGYRRQASSFATSISPTPMGKEKSEKS